MRTNPLVINNLDKQAKVYPAQIDRKCTLVTRYRCLGEDKRSFVIYVPIPLIERISDETPSEINIHLQTSPFPIKTLGFINSNNSPKTDLDYWEYELKEVMGNSIRYDVSRNNAKYSLYIPKSELDPDDYPKKVVLFVSLISE